MICFPDGFPQIEQRRMQFEHVFRFGVETGAPRNKLLRLCDYIWVLFCNHLRLDDRGHRNINIIELAQWYESSSYYDSLYDKNIQNCARKFHREDCRDEVVNMLRKRAMDEWEAIRTMLDETRGESHVSS